MSAVARSGTKDERRDACKLLLPALLKGLEEDAPRDVHLLLTALRPERDDVHVVTALSSVDGAKALRVVAAYLRSSRKDDPGAAKAAKVARTWLCVLTARHDGCTTGIDRVYATGPPACFEGAGPVVCVATGGFGNSAEGGASIVD